MCQEVFKFATDKFAEEFKTNKKAQEYMTKRGFDLDFLKELNVGYAEGDLLPNIKGKGFSKKQVLESRLIAERKSDNQMYDFFRKRIMFPISVFGNIVFMSGRDVTGEATSKYINIPLPNIYFANEELLQYTPEFVILTEGYMDCYSLLQHGFPAIGMTNCNRKSETLLKKLLRIKQVFIMFDYDRNNAGQIGAAKTAFNLIGVGHKGIRICELPHFGKPKMDVNELMLLSGAGFENKITQIISDTERNQPLFHETKLYKEMFKKEQSQIRVENELTVEENLQRIYKWVNIVDSTYDCDKYFQTCCPLHGETKGSFTVYKDTGTVTCFGCGFSGTGEWFDKEMQKRKDQNIFE
jgi:DNA primase